MFEKKINRSIVKKQQIQNAAATTIQQRLAELSAMKAKKRSKSITSSDTTYAGSEGPPTIDRREFNTGRPRNKNLAKEHLNRFQHLEIRNPKTQIEAKEFKNLQAQLFFQPMGAEDKKEHRPVRGKKYK